MITSSIEVSDELNPFALFTGDPSALLRLGDAEEEDWEDDDDDDDDDDWDDDDLDDDEDEDDEDA